MNYRATKLLFLLLSFCACNSREARVPIKPSLIQDMPEPTMHIEHGMARMDSSRVDSLLQRARQQTHNPDSALAMFNEAYSISQQLNYQAGLVMALAGLGDYELRQNKDFKAARAFYFYGLSFISDSSTLLPNMYLIVGRSYYEEGNYDSANYYFYGALKAFNDLPTIDTNLLISTYLNIGATLEKADWNYTRAMTYSLAAKQLAYQIRDTASLILIIKNIGVLHTRKRQWDSAIAVYNDGLQLVKLQGNGNAIQDMYAFIINALLYKEDFELAKAYMDSATNIDPDRVNNNLSLLQNLAYIHYYEGKFTKAIANYKQMVQLSHRNHEIEYKLNSLERLAALYDTIGNGHKAFQYQRAYSTLKDSLINLGKINAINELDVKYKTAEKDRQLARKDLEILKSQTKSQRINAILWISSLCILLLVGFLIFLRYRQTNKLRQLRQQKELDILKASIEGEHTERLRVGQQLHDGISGLLSAIKMNLATLRLNRADIADERNFITTMELADEAADELRKTAHNLVSSHLVSKGLFKAIQGFCERVAAAEIDLQVTETGDPVRLDPAKEGIIYRNIQELIHNMIRHSQATKGEISLSWQQDILLVTVEDNGKGMPSKTESKGIGFENIRSSMEKLQGSMEIDSHPDEGTSIYLEYPI